MVEVLGHASGKPVVELLTSRDGERFPLPLGVDDSYAFDHGLSRQGWVAVKVGYQIVALRDDDLFHPRRLPEGWSIAPAANRQLLLIRRYFGRSREPGEPQTIELVDSSGTVLRSVTADVDGAAGELPSGHIVTNDALLSWDGDIQPLPAQGRAEAVLGGRWLVLADYAKRLVRLFDSESGADETCNLPEGFLLLQESYNATASAVAFRWLSRDVLVVTEREGLRWLRLDFEPHSAVWASDAHLLLVGKTARRVIDVRSGAESTLEGLPRNAYPRVDVTGRFDLDELRAVTQPSWTGVIPEALRVELTEKSRERIRAAAGQAGLKTDPLETARPAISIRSCLPPKRIPVGASRLGGRPDLPKEKEWPSHRGLPMTFLAQLRCDELRAALPERDIPSNGLLVVFASIDPEDGNADKAHVEVVPTVGLKRRPWPKGLPDELRYSPSFAVAEPVMSHPDWHILRDASSAAAVERFRGLVGVPGPEHRLFGHPTTIQDSEPPSGYELLMQFDGDALLEASFADGGRLHFWWPVGSSLSGVIGDCEVEMECF
jgi:uncharacterized protein DUF1963